MFKTDGSFAALKQTLQTRAVRCSVHVSPGSGLGLVSILFIIVLPVLAGPLLAACCRLGLSFSSHTTLTFTGSKYDHCNRAH